MKNRCAWLNHSSNPTFFIRLTERHPNIRLWFSGVRPPARLRAYCSWVGLTVSVHLMYIWLLLAVADILCCSSLPVSLPGVLHCLSVALSQCNTRDCCNCWCAAGHACAWEEIAPGRPQCPVGEGCTVVPCAPVVAAPASILLVADLALKAAAVSKVFTSCQRRGCRVSRCLRMPTRSTSTSATTTRTASAWWGAVLSSRRASLATAIETATVSPAFYGVNRDSGCSLFFILNPKP